MNAGLLPNAVSTQNMTAMIIPVNPVYFDLNLVDSDGDWIGRLDPVTDRDTAILRAQSSYGEMIEDGAVAIVIEKVDHKYGRTKRTIVGTVTDHTSNIPKWSEGRILPFIHPAN